MMIGSKAIVSSFFFPIRNPKRMKLDQSSPIRFDRDLTSSSSLNLSLKQTAIPVFICKNRLNPLIRRCISADEGIDLDEKTFNDAIPPSIEEIKEIEEEEEGKIDRGALADSSVWNQMKEIVMFTGPAAGLWILGPLMSLIDTAMIGQGSSVELAALGPGTVLCDHLSYVFMFLSVATSNLVATSLARQDRKEVQHQISILLFVGLACGLAMLLLTRLFGTWAITAFTRGKNMAIIPAANTYIQIRGLAWPAILIGLIAQSASLGMKDSLGPLKALAFATIVNVLGHLVLCVFLKQGITGAAWATMVSQVVSAYMMMDALNKKGYSAFSLSVPSVDEILKISALAGPVFVTTISKIAFYSVNIYCATSMGTHILAAHQVMSQTFRLCNVWGEPLSQTAQSFMPELLSGVNQNLPKARRLLKSLVIIGITLGLVLGTVGTSVLWLFPGIYTHDKAVIHEMHKVLVHFFVALLVLPSAVALEGTLLAGRDLKYVSLVMSASFVVCTSIVLTASKGGSGLQACWYTLIGFQWVRFIFYLGRLLSRNGILYSQGSSQSSLQKA